MGSTCFVMMPHGSNGEYHLGVTEGDIVYSKIIKPALIDALGGVCI